MNTAPSFPRSGASVIRFAMTGWASDFIDCYNPLNRHERKATWDEKDAPEGRWRSFSYDELAAEIIENPEAGLSSFRKVLAGLA